MFAAGAQPGHSAPEARTAPADRKSTRLNSSHSQISYAVFCLKKKKTARPPRQSGQKPPGQREVAEIVGAKLQLLALIVDLTLRDLHHAATLDQMLEPLTAVQ